MPEQSTKDNPKTEPDQRPNSNQLNSGMKLSEIWPAPKITIIVYGGVTLVSGAVGAGLLNSRPKPVLLAWSLIFIACTFGALATRLSVINHKTVHTIPRCLPNACCFGLVLAAFIGCAFAVWHENSDSRTAQAFSVTAKVTAIFSRSASPFWLAYNLNGEALISPIGAMLFLQFVNLKSVPIMIDSMSVEVECGRGKWTNVPCMDERLGSMFAVGNDLTRGTRMKAPCLISNLTGKAIAPNDTVTGWVFLDLDPKDKFGPGQRWHLRLRETSGSEDIGQIVFLGPIKSTEIQIAETWNEEVQDISKFRRIIYSEARH